MQQVDKRYFNGGMNVDIDKHLTPDDVYTYALNMRVGLHGDKGVITTSKGNELVSFNLPSGGNKVVGAVEYVKGSKNFYLIWNSNNNHSLLMYDYESQSISVVIQDQVLDLTPDSIITAINVVQLKDNTILYYSDNNSEPKRIVVDSGIRTFDPNKKIYKGEWAAGIYQKGEVVKVSFGTDYHNRVFYYIAKTQTLLVPYDDTDVVNDPQPTTDWSLMEAGHVYPSPISERDITQLVKPPLAAPIVSYGDDPELGSNRLKGALWQFRYKYLYGDGQESAWSPISKTPIPNSQLNPLDSGYVDSLLDNIINVGVEIDNSPFIRSVKIAARVVYSNQEHTDFFQFEEVFTDDLGAGWGDVGVSSGVTVTFTNKEDKLPLNVTDLAQLYYNVPRKAKVQIITEDNRMLTSNVTEGYNIPSDIVYGKNAAFISATYNNTIPLDNSFELPITTYSVGGYYTYSFDLNDVTSIDEFDVFKIGIIGFSRVIQDNNGNPYPDGFPNGGLKRFNFTTTYRPKKVDIDNNSLSDLKEIVAQDIADLIRAQFVKTWYSRKASASKKASHYAGRYLVLGGINPATPTLVYFAEDFPNRPSTNIAAGYSVHTTITDSSVTQYKSGGTAKRDFKRGVTETFGLVYSDKLGRLATVVNNDSFVKKINWYDSSNNGSAAAATNNGQVSLSMEVRNQPPDWAVKCHIVRKIDNGVARFVQLPLSIGNVNETDTLNNTKYFVVGKVSSDGTTKEVNSTGAETICIYLNALNGSGVSAHNNVLTDSVITYSFTKGDRLRFVSTKPNISGNVPHNYYDDDVEIVGYNEQYNYIIINKGALKPPVVGNLSHFLSEFREEDITAEGAIFEIYTPQNSDEVKGRYYETGITLDIVNGEHIGTDGVSQDYANDIPALVTLDCYDVYKKERWYTTDDVGVAIGDFYFIEDYNYADNYKSKGFNVGRFNLKVSTDTIEGDDDRSGQDLERYKPNVIYWSESYIQGTNVNRLGTVYDISFKDTNNFFNSVQYIHSDGDRILIYQEDKVGFAYINRNVSTDLVGNNTVSSVRTTPVISDIQYPYMYNGGISENPESFYSSNNRIYFFDLRRGNICRHSQNGIDAISLKGLDIFTKEVSDKMLSGLEKDIAIGAYDKRNNEYTLNLKWSEEVTIPIPDGSGDGIYFVAFPDDTYMSQFVVGERITFTGASSDLGYDAVIISVIGQTVQMDFSPQTVSEMLIANVYKSTVVAFNDEVGVWSSFFSYIPDYLSAAGMDLVSWKDGQLYVHNSNNVAYGNFYGEGHDFEIETVSNADATNVKNFLTTSVSSNERYNVTNSHPLSTIESGIVTSDGQVSELINSDFRYYEGQLRAAILRDKNTPYKNLPLLEGDILKGRWMKTKFKIDSGITTAFKILSITYNNAVSFLAR